MTKCVWTKDVNGGYKCQFCGFKVPSNDFHKKCQANVKSPPGAIKKVKNFTESLVGHITTGMKHCSDEEKLRRFEICKSNQCGLFRAQDNGGICAHDDCGCYIRNNGKFMDKLSWADSKCPVGLWQQKDVVKVDTKETAWESWASWRAWETWSEK